jgi:hypothetical protein
MNTFQAEVCGHERVMAGWNAHDGAIIPNAVHDVRPCWCAPAYALDQKLFCGWQD